MSKSLAALFAFALIASACGSDSDTESVETEPPTTETESVETEPPTTDEETTTDSVAPSDGAVVIEAGSEFTSINLPKCLGISVLDEANDGAIQAAEELGSDEPAYLGPASCGDTTGQLEFVTNGVTQGVNAIMISNNSGDAIQTVVNEAADAGTVIVTYDSPIPSGEGESLFVAQVDFEETGVVMADMALNILGDDGGQLAVLSASPDSTNQNVWIVALEEALATDDAYANLELVDIVYGNDDSDESYNQALALVDTHPDLELIMAPTTVGIAAAGKALQDEGLCDTVKVSGLGLPSENVDFTVSGCTPEFALWSFVDLGYLTYYASYGIATGQIEAVEGSTFIAGRMGEYTMEADPTRDGGLRIIMGGFTIYNADNL